MLKKLLCSAFVIAAAITPVRAEVAPDALVRQISSDVIDSAKADKAIQAGDLNRIMDLVNAKVMPSLNFEVMTRSAVGPQWRQATADQRSRLQTEFKSLLVRVYSGALTQIKDQTLEITKTMTVPQSNQVVVQSEVRGKGEPIKLDYRLDKMADAWKIIDVNVGGIWLVQSYRSQFAPVLGSGGIDALIAKLVDQNKAAASGKS